MDTETEAIDGTTVEEKTAPPPGKTAPARTTRPSVFLTVHDVAAMLKCATRTVYRLADTGRMPPPCRLGKLVRWKTEAINSWIEQGCPSCRR